MAQPEGAQGFRGVSLPPGLAGQRLGSDPGHRGLDVGGLPGEGGSPIGGLARGWEILQGEKCVGEQRGCPQRHRSFGRRRAPERLQRIGGGSGQ